jgi:hypothetical protein
MVEFIEINGNKNIYVYSLVTVFVRTNFFPEEDWWRGSSLPECDS